MTKAALRKPSAKAKRSAARLAAVQALYQITLTGIDAERAISEFAAYRRDQRIDGEDMVPPDFPLFKAIVAGVAAHRVEIDDMLGAAIEAPLDYKRMEILLRAVLSAGLYELWHQPETDAPLIVKEYLDVTEGFYAGTEAKMVNGVLDRLASRLRGPDAMARRG